MALPPGPSRWSGARAAPAPQAMYPTSTIRIRINAMLRSFICVALPLDSCLGSKSLEKGVHREALCVLLREVPELLGDLSERDHSVVECVVPEEDCARFHDVEVVLEQPFFIHVRFVDLALRAVFFDEPVVTKRLRIQLLRNPYELGGLGFERFQLARADLQVRVQFELTHDSSFKPSWEGGW